MSMNILISRICFCNVYTKMKELLMNLQSNKKLKLDYKMMATDLLNCGMGDEGRLRFILDCIEKNKPLYKTDVIFLESMTEQLEHRIRRLQGTPAKTTKPKENPPRTLISDQVLDEIIGKQNAKTAKISEPVKKKSFLAKLFSR